MVSLLELFRDRCEETDILDDLLSVAAGPHGTWIKGRGCFERARARARTARRENDTYRMYQCDFEEVCGKTLYNLGGGSAPYDADSPFWVVPNALSVARLLGIDVNAILSLLDRQPQHDPAADSAPPDNPSLHP